MNLSFLLVRKAKAPAPKKVVAAALKLGIQMAAAGEDKDGMQTFELGNGETLIAALMPAPHPDAPKMSTGPTAVSADEIASCKAHVIVTLLTREPAAAAEVKLAALTAAVIEAYDAVGAMFGEGVYFHKAKLFAELAALAYKEGELPCELAVDITVARESETHMSFLTHGLVRRGREELYVVAPIRGKGALDFVYGLARWMLSDPDKQFPTGDTVGRTPEEKIRIERVPSPTGRGPEVICLRM